MNTDEVEVFEFIFIIIIISNLWQAKVTFSYDFHKKQKMLQKFSEKKILF